MTLEDGTTIAVHVVGDKGVSVDFVIPDGSSVHLTRIALNKVNLKRLINLLQKHTKE